jgi:AcrR family transcriptional regulator
VSVTESLATATSTPASGDRRSRRRQETIDEILALALEQMAEVGVSALSMSALAKRMGIRPPSLYQYFPSRLAIYDALFLAGNRALSAVLDATIDRTADPLAQLWQSAETFTRWSVAHPVYAQLMFWRPVPGFVPSEESYAPAVEQMAQLHEVFAAAVAAGELAPEVTTERGAALYTALIAGVISQQLSNEPDAEPGTGRFERALPDAFEMFVDHYRPAKRQTERKGRA